MTTVGNIRRFARWSLIGAAILMGAALLATVWSTYRSVQTTTRTLIRGQADVLNEVVRGRLDELDAASIDDAALELVLEELRPEGLRYMAVLGRGEVLAQAGTPLGPLPHLGNAEDWEAALVPVEVGDRYRAMFRGPKLRPRESRIGRPEGRGGPRIRRLPMVIEFEPRVALEQRRSAQRTVGIGAAAALALLLVAVVLVRWFLRWEALERQLEHERRLAGLGQMSAVLAHEIRNPLASLKGNAQLLARSLPEGEIPRRKADRVVDEAIRLERLTNDLLEFARSGELERAPVDPAAVLRDAVADAGDDQVELDAGAVPPSWSLDRERMRQVLGNIIGNAVQAGGPVRAAVRARAGALEYEVRDHGPGIPADDLARIFEPFYTKRTRGTGLGLAISQQIVALHGGSITAENAPDGGARFLIRIPPQ